MLAMVNHSNAAEFGAGSEILEEFLLDSGIRSGAFLALRVLCESHLLSEVYFDNYNQPAM